MSAPQVVVVYGPGPVGPAEFVRAARGLAEVVFVVDRRDGHTERAWDLLCELGPVHDLAERNLADLARALGENVKGITTFSEPLMGVTAQLALLLDLPFHSPEVASLVTDKSRQRRRLNEAAGVAPVRQRDAATGEQFAHALRDLGLPVVVKPRGGRSGIDTFLCTTESEYERTVADLLSRPAFSAAGWVVEEYLRPGRHPGQNWLGDYCSVESAVQGDTVWHYMVTDKLPLAPPFREAGGLLPSLLPEDVQEEVLAVTTAAIRALGIRHGVIHTELKFTPAGVRVLEVNGRLGGFTAGMMSRVSELDPVRLALTIALALPLEPRPLRTCGLTFFLTVLPPDSGPVLVRSLPTNAQLRDVDGVWRIDRVARVGDLLDWRKGSTESLLTISADARSATEVRERLARLGEVCGESVRLAPATGPDDPGHDGVAAGSSGI